MFLKLHVFINIFIILMLKHWVKEIISDLRICSKLLILNFLEIFMQEKEGLKFFKYLDLTKSFNYLKEEIFKKI